MKSKGEECTSKSESIKRDNVVGIDIKADSKSTGSSEIKSSPVEKTAETKSTTESETTTHLSPESEQTSEAKVIPTGRSKLSGKVRTGWI